jgi:hypothetical protein
MKKTSTLPTRKDMKSSHQSFSLMILTAALFLFVTGCALDTPIDYSIAELALPTFNGF